MVLEDRRIGDIITDNFLLLHHAKQVDSKLQSALCATFLFSPHFYIICDLLLKKRTATCNIFVNFMSMWVVFA